MFGWLARRFGRDRRWISDPAERDAHDIAVRARLAESPKTDDDHLTDHRSNDQDRSDRA
jgi:hypothetical protein